MDESFGYLAGGIGAGLVEHRLQGVGVASEFRAAFLGRIPGRRRRPPRRHLRPAVSGLVGDEGQAPLPGALLLAIAFIGMATGGNQGVGESRPGTLFLGVSGHEAAGMR